MYPYELFFGVHLYGLFIAIGILVCFFTLYFYGKKIGITEKSLDFTFYTAIVSIVAGFGSAALFQSLYNFIENPQDGFNFGGGITFIGGLIGGVVCFLIIYFLFKKYVEEKLSNLTIVASCCITIAHAFGRIGCLFAGCCHGKFLGYENVSGGIFMNGTKGWGYYVPTQLYEAIFLFVLFGILSLSALKYKSKHSLSIYLVLYGAFRFTIEFFRADNRGEFLGIISPSQFWSIIMIIAGILLSVFYVVYPKIKAKRKV